MQFFNENPDFLEMYTYCGDKPDVVFLLADVASHFNLEFEQDALSLARSLRSARFGLFDIQMWDFWMSWALSEYPSKGLIFFRESGWLEVFPEIFNLIGVSQDETRHPEGDVFNHVCLAVDEAAKIAKRENLTGEETISIVFGALCHDMGKQIQMDAHEIHGVEVARRFLKSIAAPDSLILFVEKIVRYHMLDYMFDGRLVKPSDVNSAFVARVKSVIYPVSIRMLGYVHEADTSGRGEIRYEDRMSEVFKKLLAFDSVDKIYFTPKDYASLIARDKLPYPLAFKGFHRDIFLKNVNKSLRNGSLKLHEVETVLCYTFLKSYRDAVFYVDELDYRSTASLLGYMSENNLELDTLLLKGKSGIEEILNHSDL